ncbi:hypothetical protein BDZ97DRAFT_2055028 [Flammula alnicola]|nr:hypothetical protein BDZ97DRAFT_2055028 [Flammula alnicola]
MLKAVKWRTTANDSEAASSTAFAPSSIEYSNYYNHVRVRMVTSITYYTVPAFNYFDITGEGDECTLFDVPQANMDTIRGDQNRYSVFTASNGSQSTPSLHERSAMRSTPYTHPAGRGLQPPYSVT